MSDNSWYEKGELPPVGSVCKVQWVRVNSCEKEIHDIYNGENVFIVGHDEVTGTEVAVFRLERNHELKPYYSLVSDCFLPIKTERELAIDEMISHMDSAWHKDLAAQLYDAGYRKTTPD